MKEKKNPIDTDNHDLEDYFLAVRAKDRDFLRAIRMTTPSAELQKHISRRLSEKKKRGCKAEIISLR